MRQRESSHQSLHRVRSSDDTLSYYLVFPLACSPPFTFQRLCEILLTPHAHFRLGLKFLNAVERLVKVSPGGATLTQSLPYQRVLPDGKQSLRTARVYELQPEEGVTHAQFEARLASLKAELEAEAEERRRARLHAQTAHASAAAAGPAEASQASASGSASSGSPVLGLPSTSAIDGRNAASGSSGGSGSTLSAGSESSDDSTDTADSGGSGSGNRGDGGLTLQGGFLPAAEDDVAMSGVGSSAEPEDVNVSGAGFLQYSPTSSYNIISIGSAASAPSSSGPAAPSEAVPQQTLPPVLFTDVMSGSSPGMMTSVVAAPAGSATDVSMAIEPLRPELHSSVVRANEPSEGEVAAYNSSSGQSNSSNSSNSVAVVVSRVVSAYLHTNSASLTSSSNSDSGSSSLSTAAPRAAFDASAFLFDSQPPISGSSDSGQSASTSALSQIGSPTLTSSSFASLSHSVSVVGTAGGSPTDVSSGRLPVGNSGAGPFSLPASLLGAQSPPDLPHIPLLQRLQGGIGAAGSPLHAQHSGIGGAQQPLFAAASAVGGIATAGASPLALPPVASDSSTAINSGSTASASSSGSVTSGPASQRLWHLLGYDGPRQAMAASSLATGAGDGAGEREGLSIEPSSSPQSMTALSASASAAAALSADGAAAVPPPAAAATAAACMSSNAVVEPEAAAPIEAETVASATVPTAVEGSESSVGAVSSTVSGANGAEPPAVAAGVAASPPSDSLPSAATERVTPQKRPLEGEEEASSTAIADAAATDEAAAGEHRDAQTPAKRPRLEGDEAASAAHAETV